MEIKIITVGKIKEKYLNDGIAEYAKRLSRYCKLTFCQVPDEKTPDKASDALNEQIKNTEAERLMKHIREQDYVIALAIDGKMLDSVELSEKIGRLGVEGKSSVAFVIGGSLGLGNEVLKEQIITELFQNDISSSADADDSSGADLSWLQDPEP